MSIKNRVTRLEREGKPPRDDRIDLSVTVSPPRGCGPEYQAERDEAARRLRAARAAGVKIITVRHDKLEN